MAYTIQQHDALEDAISQGILEVEYSDKKVRYRSLDEMIRILNLMKSQLGLIKPNAGRHYAVFRSGLGKCGDDNIYIKDE